MAGGSQQGVRSRADFGGVRVRVEKWQQMKMLEISIAKIGKLPKRKEEKRERLSGGLALPLHNFMYNQNKESSPRLRINRSQDISVKKSNSGHLGPNKSIITRLLFDQPKQSPRGMSFLESPNKQIAVMRITNRRSSSFQRKSKILLKPISERREQLPLPELLAIKQHPKKQLVQEDIEEMFYRQVRILQEFKKMAELIQ